MTTETETAAAKLARIQAHLAVRGNKIMICTYTRATVYDSRHVGMFRATERSLYVQRGRSWDCIDYCGIRFGTPKVAR